MANIALIELVCDESVALRYSDVDAAIPLATGNYNVSFEVEDFTNGAFRVVLAGTAASPAAFGDGAYGPYTVEVTSVLNNKIHLLGQSNPGGRLFNVVVEPA